MYKVYTPNSLVTLETTHFAFSQQGNFTSKTNSTILLDANVRLIFKILPMHILRFGLVCISALLK